MSDLYIDASNWRLSMNIYSRAESGIYAGVKVRRYPYTGAIPQTVYDSSTHRAWFQTLSDPNKGFDADLILMRKIVNFNDNASTSSICFAFYFEIHLHKKTSSDTNYEVTLPSLWFPNNSPERYFMASPLQNVSLYVNDTSQSDVQLFEVDPVSKARQIYDSV